MQRSGSIAFVLLASLAAAVFGCGDDAAPSSSSGASGSSGGSSSGNGGDGGGEDLGGVVTAVEVARATAIPECTVFVDAAGNGAQHTTIAAAVAAADAGAVICVAEGTYAEKLSPGNKHFTLAGGFKSGSNFKLRDSASYRTKAQGNGSGAFFSASGDNVAKGKQSAIDGFEITGYAQAIVRNTYFSQSFDVTNNFIHDNDCGRADAIGGAVSFNNVSGRISGNVFSKNRCGRGGAVAIVDTTNSNTVRLERNRVTENAGTEPESAHGGAFYMFANKISLVGNLFIANTVTGWGGAVMVASDGDTDTNVTAAWNVYRENRAGNTGGGFFCDDGAKCTSDHEIFDGNCGGNVYFDSGADKPTVATYDHLVSINAKAAGCSGAGIGLNIDKDNEQADAHTIKNAIFWGNAPGKDIAANCISGCDRAKINVSFSNVQTNHVSSGGIKVTFGEGITSVDPLFVDPANQDFHLRSTKGHWTATGYQPDEADSPALAVGDPQSPVKDNPERAGTRTELGAYGNSAQASYVR